MIERSGSHYEARALFFSSVALLIVIVDLRGPTGNSWAPALNLSASRQRDHSGESACLYQRGVAGSRKSWQFAGLSVNYFISASNVTVATRALGRTDSALPVCSVCISCPSLLLPAPTNSASLPSFSAHLAIPRRSIPRYLGLTAQHQLGCNREFKVQNLTLLKGEEVTRNIRTDKTGTSRNATNRGAQKHHPRGKDAAKVSATLAAHNKHNTLNVGSFHFSPTSNNYV